MAAVTEDTVPTAEKKPEEIEVDEDGSDYTDGTEEYESDEEYDSADDGEEGFTDAEREPGVGQESEETETLDDDEDKANPAYIPRKGAFYLHDSRDDGETAAVTDDKPGKKLWTDPERWSHDKYDESLQAPKSDAELKALYGYDVRSADTPPESVPETYMRGRGRRGRGGSREGTNLGSYIDNKPHYNNSSQSRGGGPPRGGPPRGGPPRGGQEVRGRGYSRGRSRGTGRQFNNSNYNKQREENYYRREDNSSYNNTSYNHSNRSSNYQNNGSSADRPSADPTPAESSRFTNQAPASNRQATPTNSKASPTNKQTQPSNNQTPPTNRQTSPANRHAPPINEQAPPKSEKTPPKPVPANTAAAKQEPANNQAPSTQNRTQHQSQPAAPVNTHPNQPVEQSRPHTKRYSSQRTRQKPTRQNQNIQPINPALQQIPAHMPVPQQIPQQIPQQQIPQQQIPQQQIPQQQIPQLPRGPVVPQMYGSPVNSAPILHPSTVPPLVAPHQLTSLAPYPNQQQVITTQHPPPRPQIPTGHTQIPGSHPAQHSAATHHPVLVQNMAAPPPPINPEPVMGTVYFSNPEPQVPYNDTVYYDTKRQTTNTEQVQPRQKNVIPIVNPQQTDVPNSEETTHSGDPHQISRTGEQATSNEPVTRGQPTEPPMSAAEPIQVEQPANSNQQDFITNETRDHTYTVPAEQTATDTMKQSIETTASSAEPVQSDQTADFSHDDLDTNETSDQPDTVPVDQTVIETTEQSTYPSEQPDATEQTAEETSKFENRSQSCVATPKIESTTQSGDIIPKTEDAMQEAAIPRPTENINTFEHEQSDKADSETVNESSPAVAVETNLRTSTEDETFIHSSEGSGEASSTQLEESEISETKTAEIEEV